MDLDPYYFFFLSHRALHLITYVFCMYLLKSKNINIFAKRIVFMHELYVKECPNILFSGRKFWNFHIKSRITLDKSFTLDFKSRWDYLSLLVFFEQSSSVNFFCCPSLSRLSENVFFPHISLLLQILP